MQIRTNTKKHSYINIYTTGKRFDPSHDTLSKTLTELIIILYREKIYYIWDDIVPDSLSETNDVVDIDDILGSYDATML